MESEEVVIISVENHKIVDGRLLFWREVIIFKIGEIQVCLNSNDTQDAEMWEMSKVRK